MSRKTSTVFFSPGFLCPPPVVLGILPSRSPHFVFRLIYGCALSPLPSPSFLYLFVWRHHSDDSLFPPYCAAVLGIYRQDFVLLTILVSFLLFFSSQHPFIPVLAYLWFPFLFPLMLKHGCFPLSAHSSAFSSPVNLAMCTG